MMKAHGISTVSPSGRSTSIPAAGRRDEIMQAKKRKMDFFGQDENIAVDDDEGLNGIKDEPYNDPADNLCIKEEGHGEVEILGTTAPLLGTTSESGFRALSSGGSSRPPEEFFNMNTETTGRRSSNGADIRGKNGSATESILIPD